MKRFCMTVVTILLAPAALGWGIHAHQLANEAATAGLDGELPQFFLEAFPRIVYLGYDPDRWRSGGPSLTSWNFPDHFVDLEYIEHLELPPRRYDFIELLIESGTLDRYGIDPTTPGFGAWRIAELSELLENQWRIWLRDDLSGPERAQVEATIVYYSGIVGHYVSDAANPHHSTIHYNGWVGVPNENDYPVDCGAHWRFESEYATRVVDRMEVIDRLRPLVLRVDYFEEALGFYRDSNRLVEQMYALDRDGAFTGQGTEAGESFAVERVAQGASWLRDLWVSTYRAAQE